MHTHTHKHTVYLCGKSKKTSREKNEDPTVGQDGSEILGELQRTVQIFLFVGRQHLLID